MKISKVEFENFRNFRDRCCIEFPTDGSVTVIYGPNGVGKTTLHQLFQWIFYGEVHFNKTASPEMYNLDFERSTNANKMFSVKGTADFEHPDRNGTVEYYSLRREWVYEKKDGQSKLADEKVRLSKKIGDDWKTIQDPDKVVEQILPKGLSQYFFFDGESMIADLNQKGKAAAKSLRKALYSIFDLDVYEQAIVHIGAQTGGTSTVLGKLYSELSENSSNKDISRARGDYNLSLRKVEKLTEDIKQYQESIERYRKEVQDLSEKIGGNPSRVVLESRRKKAKDTIKTMESAIERETKNFGKTVMANYPHLFLSRIVEEAEFRISLKVEEEKLLPGLRKELVLALLEEKVCLCGNLIEEKERAALEALKKLFPPLSYKYIYDQFKNSAKHWSAAYDRDILIQHLEAIFQYKDQIEDLNREIHDIDEEEKQGKNVDTLIADRAKAEELQRSWEDKFIKAKSDLKLQETIMKKKKKTLDELLAKCSENECVKNYISVMEAVKVYFESALTSSAKKYSESLGTTIQELLGRMLRGVRKVSMTPKFELSVKDSHGNEAKSEGQFAIVSFAYIGGILKLLGETSELKGKEFPLVLDGPFSKLDAQHRQNVIDVIPTYAPQVILFSKDDINDCFGEKGVENVWTIYSNDERNISRVEKGYNPEVFSVNGTEY